VFHSRVVEVLNSGTAWAFLGSGVCADAGLPTWGGLVDAVLARVPGGARDAIEHDPLYLRAVRDGRHDSRFARIQAHVGRSDLEHIVETVLEAGQEPGWLHQTLADLPFRSYITTNYDPLLEAALRSKGLHGWASVGNTPEEIRKLAGNPERVIWHLHGCLGGDPRISRLVLTDADYDDVYLAEDSPASLALRSLFLMAPVVFVGFSFTDPEVSRVLRRVGRLASPARPLIAFVPDLSGPEHEAERDDFLTRYNIDVIPYEAANGSHAALRSTLDLHSAFVLKRSLRFGHPRRAVPSFDPETTSLMLYNELVIGPSSNHASSVLEGLLRARVIALLTHQGSLSLLDLDSDLRGRTSLLVEPAGSNGGACSFLANVVGQLVAERVVSVEMMPAGQRYALTPEWQRKAEQRSARAALLASQFAESLRGRTLAMGGETGEPVERVVAVATAFLGECVKRRAIGTAMTLAAREEPQQRFHIVALLQALPDFMAQLSSAAEAYLLSRLVRDVLTSPSEAERIHLGLALQAAFGAQLLGCAPDAVRARLDDLSSTLFLIDSTTLIPYLAKGCVAHEAARFLLQRLTSMGCEVATLTSLAEEVAEHARYAMHRVSAQTGSPDLSTLKAITGRAGGRSNEFLNGFLTEISKGTVQPDLSAYLGASCRVPVSRTSCSAQHVQEALRLNGIACLSFQDWPDFQGEFWAEREAVAGEIARRRKQLGNFKHDRQTRAEAESLIVVRESRNQQLGTLSGAVPRAVRNAYFVSRSRVIDDVARPTLPVTMRPEAITQWVATLAPCDMAELASTFDLVLLELAEQGFRVIEDRTLLTVFGPLVDASRDRLPEIRLRYSTLLANRLGEDPSRAFAEVPDLELPVATESFYAQLAESLERRALKSEAVAPLNKSERARLTKLESDARARTQRKQRRKKTPEARKRAKRKRKKARRKRK